MQLRPWKSAIALTLPACLFSGAGSAYPVLDAVTGLPHPELVSVYPDSDDSNLYYFVPTSVALVREGEDVRLGVQYWGLTGPDPEGVGAALTFSVEPAYDRAVVDQVAAGLKERNPAATFAFPTLKESRMEIILNGAFFPQNQSTTQPTTTTGGTVDATQAFSIGLNGVGARAFAQGVAPDSDVLGARYTYSFLGVEKRLHARITANYKRVYEHFSAAANANAWWGLVQASWQSDWQTLRQNEGIKLEILEGGAAETDAYMLEVFKTLVNAQVNGESIFKPSLQPAGLAAKPEAARSGWGFSASAAWEQLDEEKELVFEINKRSLGEREFQVGLTFAAVCARYPDNFADLTNIGNQCLERAELQEVQEAAVRCLKAKLTRLKEWFDEGLMPESVYLAQVNKAYEEPCYGEPEAGPLAALRSDAATSALQKIESAVEDGRATETAQAQIISGLLARPSVFQSPSVDEIVSDSIRTLGGITP